MKSIDEQTSFATICKECKDIWEGTSLMSIHLLPRVTRKHQQQNEEVLSSLLESVERHHEMGSMQGIEEELQIWLRQDMVWNLSWMNEEERDSFLSTTKQFMKDARAFDADLSMADIGQAMRNLWIILILEKVCNRPMKYHKAMFAYSMLYPYTDNLLDDDGCSRKEKECFNHWLERRLKGETQCFELENQKKVHKLVTMIEECYARKHNPKVYEALLHIQHGQCASLLQYDVLDEDVLLEISIAKGGASVLADGYLIDGTLREEEASFCVKFGFLLQLADDIQDLQQDRKQGYHTPFGILERRVERRKFCEKYFGFVHEVMKQRNLCKDKRLRNFIEQNCNLLVYFSLHLDAQMYPMMFMHHIRKRLPIHARELKKFISKFTQQSTCSLDMLDDYLALE